MIYKILVYIWKKSIHMFLPDIIIINKVLETFAVLHL